MYHAATVCIVVIWQEFQQATMCVSHHNLQQMMWALWVSLHADDASSIIRNCY